MEIFTELKEMKKILYVLQNFDIINYYTKYGKSLTKFTQCHINYKTNTRY